MENTLPASKRQKIETGFVGLFDILGYKSFLTSGITDVTFKVVDFLDGLPERVYTAYKTFFGPLFDKSEIKQDMDRIHFRVVSDSILLALSYDESRDKPAQAAAFLVTANVLEQVMFVNGLPLRGAIAFGDYIFGELAFAGKPIIDAYTLGQTLDLAACAIHETAEIEFEELASKDRNWDNFLVDDKLVRVRYLAPVKKSTGELAVSCLNLIWPELDGQPLLAIQKDLRQYVHEVCMAHGKQIGLDAILKVENTERFLRFLLSHDHKRPYGKL